MIFLGWGLPLHVNVFRPRKKRALSCSGRRPVNARGAQPPREGRLSAIGESAGLAVSGLRAPDVCAAGGLGRFTVRETLVRARINVDVIALVSCIDRVKIETRLVYSCYSGDEWTR